MGLGVIGPRPARVVDQTEHSARLEELVDPAKERRRGLGASTIVDVVEEEAVLDSAVNEFADLEKMLRVTEESFGPYRWDRYDLLIMPPSFPYGGMENPRLSFITPSAITADKSLVSVIAHELAHSWSGNLVTNYTWRDFWLNEGFTTYLTNRIMQLVYGDSRYHLEMSLGYERLTSAMERTDDTRQSLVIDSSSRDDPFDDFSMIPYEKGALFLYELEQAVGRTTFDQFLREYFQRFAFQSITTEEFLRYLERMLLNEHGDSLNMDRVHAWIFEPGIPAGAPRIVSDVFASVDRIRDAWLGNHSVAADIDTSGWSYHEWVYFLNGMPKQLV